MDIQAYISSGIVEAYVLGLASDEEMKEVESYAVQYSEIKNAITDFEINLENESLQNAIQPPAFLKEKIMAAIRQESNGITTEAPVSDTPNHTTAKVISIAPAPKSVKWLRGAVAASVILFLGSAILNFYYYSQYKKFNRQYSDLLASQTTLTAKVDAYRASFNMISDTAVVKVTMQAASADRAGSVATIFWNKKSQDVLLTVNNLPEPALGKQYQLWAIVDGKPVDAGMIQSNKIGDVTAASKMVKLNNAQAFAITLEKEGGSPAPDMKQLYVLGKV